MFKPRFILNQLMGVGCITAFIGLGTVGMFVYEKINPAYTNTHATVSGFDGSGRRGMLLVWLLVVFVFTIINLVIAMRRHFGQPG